MVSRRKAVPSNSREYFYRSNKPPSRKWKQKSDAPLQFLISVTACKCCNFLHEVITWDHISGAVPAALCCWDESARSLAVSGTQSGTWQPLGAPGRELPKLLGLWERLLGLETSYARVAQAHFKGRSAGYSWSFSKKHSREGMSGQEGARRQPLMGSENTEQGKPTQSQNEKVLLQPNFSWSNWRREMPEPILREKQAPD